MMYSQLVNMTLPAAVTELVPNQLFPPAMVPGRQCSRHLLAGISMPIDGNKDILTRTRALWSK